LKDNLDLVQLALVEYAYNFIPEFMPVECAIMGILPELSTYVAITCDSFREKSISTGQEDWASFNAMASSALDRLLRSHKLGIHTETLVPVVFQHCRSGYFPMHDTRGRKVKWVQETPTGLMVVNHSPEMPGQGKNTKRRKVSAGHHSLSQN